MDRTWTLILPLLLLLPAKTLGHKEPNLKHDSSTNNLIRRYRKMK